MEQNLINENIKLELELKKVQKELIFLKDTLFNAVWDYKKLDHHIATLDYENVHNENEKPIYFEYTKEEFFKNISYFDLNEDVDFCLTEKSFETLKNMFSKELYDYYDKNEKERKEDVKFHFNEVIEAIERRAKLNYRRKNYNKEEITR